MSRSMIILLFVALNWSCGTKTTDYRKTVFVAGEVDNACLASQDSVVSSEVVTATFQTSIGYPRYGTGCKNVVPEISDEFFHTFVSTRMEKIGKKCTDRTLFKDCKSSVSVWQETCTLVKHHKDSGLSLSELEGEVRTCLVKTGE